MSPFEIFGPINLYHSDLCIQPLYAVIPQHNRAIQVLGEDYHNNHNY